MTAEAYSRGRPVEERFWSKVDRSTDDRCWPWRGGYFRRGNGSPSYGAFSIGRRMGRAHRVAYELTFGSIPQGMAVCHACDNPACCNPNHLWLGTNADNVRDRDGKDRAARGERAGTAKLTAAQVAAILSDPREQREIARDYGISKSTVGNIRRGEGWSHIGIVVDCSAISYRNRSLRTRGEGNGAARLNPTQVRQIRDDPRPQRMIAADYGVSKSLIGNIKRGDNWGHL